MKSRKHGAWSAKIPIPTYLAANVERHCTKLQLLSLPLHHSRPQVLGGPRLTRGECVPRRPHGHHRGCGAQVRNSRLTAAGKSVYGGDDAERAPCPKAGIQGEEPEPWRAKLPTEQLEAASTQMDGRRRNRIMRAPLRKTEPRKQTISVCLIAARHSAEAQRDSSSYVAIKGSDDLGTINAAITDSTDSSATTITDSTVYSPWRHRYE